MVVVEWKDSLVEVLFYLDRDSERSLLLANKTERFTRNISL